MNRSKGLFRAWVLASGMVGLALACSEGPTGPESGINPGLLDPDGNFGITAGAESEVPQGSAVFTGPGGMPMDATAEEFIQRVTLTDGTVLKTSGITVRAVPDEAVTSPSFDRLSFGSASTGSLESVPLGSYTVGPWPEIDFIHEIDFSYGQIRMRGATQYTRAEDGVVTFTSLNYFDDVYPCELSTDAFDVDLCEYQIGLLQGSVRFTVPLDGGGQVVQEETAFSVPIQRRTIIARQK